MRRVNSTAAGWLGGLAVWSAAMLGLAAMPSPDVASALATIGGTPSPHAIAANEDLVEMGLLDPVGPEVPTPVEVPSGPARFPSGEVRGASALMVSGEPVLCPISGSMEDDV